MPSAILAPAAISTTELDDFLANGWRPLGQRIYTADFIQLDLGEIFSVIPTRLPLEKHQWKKRHRKLLRQNNARFTYQIGPAQIDDEKLRVNERYMVDHPEKSTDELEIHTSHMGRQIFNTLECCVYHEGQLVAFSFFDQGATSAYSKAGVYDPAYRKYSLGIYTMLLEMRWCQVEGIKYYYPGYVSPDIPLFDYKKEIGAIEFWSLRHRLWFPYTDYDPNEHAPLGVMKSRLEEAQDTLSAFDYEAGLYQYVFFEMQMMQKGHHRLLDTPCFLFLHCPTAQQAWIGIYRLETDCYECWHCDFNRMITFFEPAPRGVELFPYVLELRKLRFRCATAQEFSVLFHEQLDSKTQNPRPRQY
ncbi:MAG: GNAT family N-acetyltransferase [Bacteroidota bacterium]